MNIPFLWVPVLALACYLLLLVALLPAFKSRAVRAFDGLLLCFVLWTGGSMLMRMLLWPGWELWYLASLLALFFIPGMLYRFLCEFFGMDRPREKALVWLLTLATAVPNLFELYISKPVLERLPGGAAVFRYHVDWRCWCPRCCASRCWGWRCVWRAGSARPRAFCWWWRAWRCWRWATL